MVGTLLSVMVVTTALPAVAADPFATPDRFAVPTVEPYRLRTEPPPCLDVSFASWAERGRAIILPIPAIPFGAWTTDDTGLFMVWDPLSGGADRVVADRMARQARADAASGVDTRFRRWVVIEVAGAFHAYSLERYRARPPDPLDHTAYCYVAHTNDDHRLVAMYAKSIEPGADLVDPSDDRVVLADWTVEEGQVIRDASTGDVIASRPAGADATSPPDIPFEAGPVADAWLLANVNGRGTAQQCSRFDRSDPLYTGSIAGITCLEPTAWFMLFESSAALDAYFGRRRAAVRNACSASTWHLGDAVLDPKGGFHCWQGSDSRWYVEWTEDLLHVGAVTSHEDYDTAYRNWSTLARSP